MTVTELSGTLHIGTAGWAIPREQAGRFRSAGTALARYGEVLRCAEINSTFYRSHRASTYSRWIDSVPEHFRFSLKVPKAITHECGLAPEPERMRAFLDEARLLGPKLGPILFQLPPRQRFFEDTARVFFELFRDAFPAGDAVLEPRHADWFSVEADDLLQRFRMGRVVADPPPTPAASETGGDRALVYYRLHGSPRTYYSSYSPEVLQALAMDLRRHAVQSQIWCIFDNTASGAAMSNALSLLRMVGDEESP